MRLVLHNCTFDVSFKKILKWLIDISGAPNENIAQNHINIALLNVL